MSRRHVPALPLLVGALALAYLVPFRAYGLNVDDEGTLLYQIARVARGELPYVDFSTGYTPVFFLLASRTWHAAGDIVVFRTALAVVHAVTAAVLAWLVGRIARPALAVLAPLAYLAFIPVFPGEFCAFNVPYPAWLATLGWVVTASAMVAFVSGRRQVWLVGAGMVAAAMLGIKPNAGVFAIAAAIATLLLVSSAEADAHSGAATVAWIILWTGVVSGVCATFGRRVAGVEGLVYVAPVALAMGALWTRSRVGRVALVGDALALLTPFAALSAPWVAFFLVRLGPSRFAHEVLLIGSGAADLYYRPYPPFELWALLLTVFVATGAAAGALVRRHPRLLPAAVAVAAGGLLTGVLAVAYRGLMPERVTWSIIWQLESAGFPLTLATHAAGVLWLWRRRALAAEPAAVVLLFALFMYLQLYPRADFTHLVIAAPLTLVFAAFLLERVIRWWEQGVHRAGWRGRRVVSIAAALTLAAAIALRMSPSLAALATVDRGDALPFSIAPVRVDRVHGGDLRDLGAAATALAAALGPTADGPPVSLGFPALDVMLLLAGARNPTPHDYFYPGRPDHGDEAAIVDTLAAAPPRALASLNRHFTFFDAAPTYYFVLRRFVSERYELRARDGRYDILVRRDIPEPPARDAARASRARDGMRTAPAALAGGSLTTGAAALLAQATSDEATARADALAMLADALSREPVAGLETYVSRAGLDLRHQVLLLRTIRDAREARAATYLFQALASGEPRLVNEALDAMERTRAELIARRHLWAGPEVPQVWPGRQALVTAIRGTLADARAPARAVAFAAELARAVADEGAVPALRMRLAADDAATTVSAAAALAELAPEGLACELVPLLARHDAAIAELLPSVLLRLAEHAEPVRSEARACLAAATTTPSGGRADAIWIAGVLADPSFASAFDAALRASEVGVRAAAAWALGELPADPSTDALLARIAADDADDMTRRLARAAAAKRHGTVPRASARTAL